MCELTDIQACSNDTPNKVTRVAIVTNIPAPYRTKIYQKLATHWGQENFKVFYCTEKQENRQWILHQNGFNFAYLKGIVLKWNNRYIHFNSSIYKSLISYNPNIIITTGFNPTYLFAFCYALIYKKVHITMTDGTLDSEQKLTFIHRATRRLIYQHSKAFIGASLGSLKLYESYGISKKSIFKSQLCANNDGFSRPLTAAHRSYDLMFSGRFSPEKNPLFAIDVAVGVAKVLNRKVTLLMLGNGPLFKQANHYATTVNDFVEVIFPGFVQQEELPQHYCSAKVFLFPTAWDPWGVVANEACAAGQVVIISPNAGAANDLVIDGENGYVIDLNLDLWIKKTACLFNNIPILEQFSKDSLLKVQAFNYDAATTGIIDTVSSITMQ